MAALQTMCATAYREDRHQAQPATGLRHRVALQGREVGFGLRCAWVGHLQADEAVAEADPHIDPLAARIRCHESLISHIERGRRAPTLDFAKEADRTFGLDGHFVTLCTRISQSSALGWFARWVEEIEPQAVILQSWDPLLIPGLLQNADYARAIFSTTAFPDRMEERVQARTRRIDIFAGPNPPTFLALIDEGVLHRPIGGPDVLAGQLRHLYELAQHPRITVQLVPIAAGCAPGMMSAFALARLREGSEVVSADSILSGQVTGDHEAVAQLKQRYDRIRADAQPKSATKLAIEDAIRKWTR